MGRLVGFVTVGALGLAVVGCSGGASEARSVAAKKAEMCTAVDDLSNSLGPITTINSSTPVPQLLQVRDEVERSVPKVIDKQGMLGEDLRTGLKGARNEFVLAVASFGGTTTVGSAAQRFNEPFQGIKGRVSAIKASVDCTP
jgi:hypothetical protein